MFRLYGFFTQNSMKPLYVMEGLGVEFEFVFVNLYKGEQKSAAFLEKTPLGKVPLLEHDGEYLFESGAICRYVADVANSPLFPEDKLRRARVDQWMDFFSNHLGRWLSKLFFEQVIKPKAKLGEPDQAQCEETTKFAHQQFKILNDLLEHTSWIANDELSIADLTAFAYIEQVHPIKFPLQEYPHVSDWFDRLAAHDIIARARERLPPR